MAQDPSPSWRGQGEGVGRVHLHPPNGDLSLRERGFSPLMSVWPMRKCYPSIPLPFLACGFVRADFLSTSPLPPPGPAAQALLYRPPPPRRRRITQPPAKCSTSTRIPARLGQAHCPERVLAPADGRIGTYPLSATAACPAGVASQSRSLAAALGGIASPDLRPQISFLARATRASSKPQYSASTRFVPLTV
jgi:hypothetical protein